MATNLPALTVAASLALTSPASTTAAQPPHPSTVTPQACEADGADTAGHHARRQKTFEAGLGLTIGGLALGLLVGGPALLMRRNARQDADRATYEARQRRYARRADRREVVAFSAIGAGGVIVLIGIPLMVAGSRSKDAGRASVSPVLSPTMAGMNAQLRF